MKVNSQVTILELPMVFNNVERILNLTLISDPLGGLTLVDTGLPNQVELIEAAMAKDGFSIDNIRQIVLTHHDLDHVGSLNELVKRTGAKVIALKEEVPYIDGTLRSIKYPSDEVLRNRPELAKLLESCVPTAVDEPVVDRTILDSSGGAVVIATPGHTPGHLCLYLPMVKTLITGDALVSENGILKGPVESATPDMEAAKQSVRKLTRVNVTTIVCYHGGLVADDANGQLQRLAMSL